MDFIDVDLIFADFEDLLHLALKPDADKTELEKINNGLKELQKVIENVLNPEEAKKEAIAEAKKEAKKAKTAKKEAKDKPNTFTEEEGKKYYDSLKVGDVFKYVVANGSIITAKKIEVKSKNSKTAGCEVVSGLEIENGKTRKRYPKFAKLLKVEVVKPEKVVKAEIVNNPVKTAKAEKVVKSPAVKTAKVESIENPICLKFKTNFPDEKASKKDERRISPINKNSENLKRKGVLFLVAI